MEKKHPVRDILTYALLGLALVGIIGLCIHFWPDIMRIIASPESIEAWLAGFGIWAPLVFIGVQFLQVVIFIIPGEVTQLAGGFFFGIGPGLTYSLVGIGLGSSFAFLVARKLGLAFVTRLFGAAQVGKFEAFISSGKAMAAFFLLFLFPGIPKDILCYVAGLSLLPFGWFMLISMLGRLPALVGSMIIGNAAANQDWTLLVVIGIVCAVLFTLGIIFRAPILQKLESLTKAAPPPEPTENPADKPRQQD